jgi:hypothetical protein
MEDRAHYFSLFCPLFAFSKNDSITKNSDSILNKKSIFDIILLIEVIFLQKLRISQNHKHFVQDICNKASTSWESLVCNFGEIIFISLLFEWLLSQMECSNNWYKRQQIDTFLPFELSHSHIRSKNIFLTNIAYIEKDQHKKYMKEHFPLL